MCVIASLYLENQSILVKNRDRKYIADVEVIHELRNGVEVLYIHDIGTDWSEGINEFGIGITNATLMVNQDEREGVVVKKRTNTISNDGKKIREALSLHNIDSTVKYLTDYKNKNQNHNGLKGITYVCTKDKKYIIEGTNKHEPAITLYPTNSLIVRTNHGIIYPSAGYNKGIKRKSSVSRLDISHRELSNANKISEVLDILSKQYTEDNFLNPYRRQSEYQIFTTGQILMNLNTLTLQYCPDDIYCKYIGYNNLLPEGYDSKLKFELLNAKNNTHNIPDSNI